jgi:hypothetical protein
MAEINSTNINDLPTDPIGGGSIGGNVSLIAQESSQQQMQIPSQTNQMSLDQSTISQIVNGLQQASLSGVTSLPSRDIPMNTDGLMKDEQVQPNYIPHPSVKDYIHETDDDINNYMRKERLDNSLDAFYDEFQTPLLLAVLYFIFQLPVFKKILYQYIPFLFFKDGNYNINGLLFTSGLFAFIYYSVSKSVKHFSRF